MYLIMPNHAIYTKKNTVKKLDATNRIKVTHDMLAEMIGIDDCYFSSGPVEKVVNNVDTDRYVQIILKPSNIKTVTQLDI